MVNKISPGRTFLSNKIKIIHSFYGKIFIVANFCFCKRKYMPLSMCVGAYHHHRQLLTGRNTLEIGSSENVQEIFHRVQKHRYMCKIYFKRIICTMENEFPFKWSHSRAIPYYGCGQYDICDLWYMWFSMFVTLLNDNMLRFNCVLKYVLAHNWILIKWHFVCL